MVLATKRKTLRILSDPNSTPLIDDMSTGPRQYLMLSFNYFVKLFFLYSLTLDSGTLLPSLADTFPTHTFSNT